MYQQPASAPMQTVYQMDPSHVDAIYRLKDHAYQLCSKYINHHVQIQTIHGQLYEGYIVHVDGTHLYLQTMLGHAGNARGFFNPFQSFNTYNNVILPLVLYELLVIALL